MVGDLIKQKFVSLFNQGRYLEISFSSVIISVGSFTEVVDSIQILLRSRSPDL